MYSYNSKKEIKNRIKEHYDKVVETYGENNVFGVFLYGSQNYVDNMFFKDSDIDSNAVILPTIKNICLGTIPKTKVKVLDNKEHISIYDIRRFVETLKKPGVNNYEVLFTEYFYVNPKYKDFYNNMVKIREKLVRTNEKKLSMSIMGISRRIYSNITNNNKEQNKKDIKEFGYSRKRLSNILRLNKSLKKYLEGADFESVLKAESQDLIYNVRKTNYYNCSDALKLAKETVEETEKIARSVEPALKNKESIDFLENSLVKLLSNRVVENN